MVPSVTVLLSEAEGSQPTTDEDVEQSTAESAQRRKKMITSSTRECLEQRLDRGHIRPYTESGSPQAVDEGDSKELQRTLSNEFTLC